MAFASLSVVVPAHNEAEGILEFHARLSRVMNALPNPWEVVYVNDGSTDQTLIILERLHATDPHTSVVNLSRNFGKEIATTAGLDHAIGAAVVVIDADLQDPPEVIPCMVAAWQDGYDMVYGQRRSRHSDTWMKRKTAGAFYRLMENIGDVPVPPNVGDFRLMSRRVVDALLQLREQHRFMKGLFSWVGFPSCAVPYDRAPRQTGRTKWTYWQLWNLAVEGVTSFSVMPLKLASYFGLLVAVCAGLFGLQLLVRTLLLGNAVAGYASLMSVILFLGGVQLVALGIIGEYLGRIFNETKQRPLYLRERFLAASGRETAAQIAEQAVSINP